MLIFDDSKQTDFDERENGAYYYYIMLSRMENNGKTSQLKWIHSQWMVNGLYKRLLWHFQWHIIHSLFLLLQCRWETKLWKMHVIKKSADIIINSKVLSTKFHVLCESENMNWIQFFILYVNDLSHFCSYNTFMRVESLKLLSPWRYTFFKYHSPFFDWECLARHSERCFSNMSKIHRLNTKRTVNWWIGRMRWVFIHQ